MNEVVRGLWQTGTMDGPIPPDGFDLVVNLAGEPAVGFSCRTVNAPLADGEMMPEWPNLIRALAALINMHLLVEKKVLVYCNAGWNRSGVVVARALMGNGLTFDQAVGAVRKARGPNALSNPHFVEWLKGEDIEYQPLETMGVKA